MAETKITKRMKTHINGGKAFCEYRDEICEDGKATGIVMVTRFEGRPRKVAVCSLYDGEEEFDAIEKTNTDVLAWVRNRLELRNQEMK